jgi:hypothetical protein
MQADAPADLAPAADLPVAVAPDAAAAGVDLAIDSQPGVGPDLAHDVAPTATVVVGPMADTFVENGESAARNFGTATSLEVKTQPGNDNTRIAFFRFSIPQLAGTVTAATLRVYGRSDTAPTSDSVYAVMDDAWTETGISWNNKPALGNKLATAVVTTAPQYHEWTVTTFVREQRAAGRTSITLAVSMDMATPASPDTFNSREAASNRPLINLTFGP